MPPTNAGSAGLGLFMASDQAFGVVEANRECLRAVHLDSLGNPFGVCHGLELTDEDAPQRERGVASDNASDTIFPLELRATALGVGAIAKRADLHRKFFGG